MTLDVYHQHTVGFALLVFFERLKAWERERELERETDHLWWRLGNRMDLAWGDLWTGDLRDPSIALALTQFFSDLRVWQFNQWSLPMRHECMQKVHDPSVVRLGIGVYSFCVRDRWHDGPCEVDRDTATELDAPHRERMRRVHERDAEADACMRMWTDLDKDERPT